MQGEKSTAMLALKQMRQIIVPASSDTPPLNELHPSLIRDLTKARVNELAQVLTRHHDSQTALAPPCQPNPPHPTQA